MPPLIVGSPCIGGVAAWVGSPCAGWLLFGDTRTNVGLRFLDHHPGLGSRGSAALARCDRGLARRAGHGHDNRRVRAPERRRDGADNHRLALLLAVARLRAGGPDAARHAAGPPTPRRGWSSDPLHSEPGLAQEFARFGWAAHLDVCRVLAAEEMEQQLARRSADTDRGFPSPRPDGPTGPRPHQQETGAAQPSRQEPRCETDIARAPRPSPHRALAGRVHRLGGRLRGARRTR